MNVRLCTRALPLRGANMCDLGLYLHSVSAPWGLRHLVGMKVR